jgi:hypothetical protein
MKQNFIRLLILPFVLLLSSCIVPSGGHSFSPQDTAVIAGKARVIIYRRNNTGGPSAQNTGISNTDFDISVDHKHKVLLSQISGKGYVSFLLNPGTHMVTIRENDGNKRVQLRQSIMVKSGRSYFFLLPIYLQKVGQLVRVNGQVAKSQMTETRWDSWE